MLPHEYIRFRLTGECMTDVTSASSMQLLNVPKRQWAGELFSALDLDRSIVAPLCECIETVGRTTQEIQELTGIPKGIPCHCGRRRQCGVCYRDRCDTGGELFYIYWNFRNHLYQYKEH